MVLLKKLGIEKRLNENGYVQVPYGDIQAIKNNWEFYTNEPGDRVAITTTSLYDNSKLLIGIPSLNNVGNSSEVRDELVSLEESLDLIEKINFLIFNY